MAADLVSRLGLGSAQFGLAYGISNRLGVTPPSEVERILALAAGAGIRHLDTAPRYHSEEAIGRAMPTPSPFAIVTKIPENVDPDRLERSLRESLSRLGVKSLHGALFHDAEAPLRAGGQRLFDRLFDLRAEGIVDRIGVSVYRESEIDRLFGRYPFDLVQVPINLFDQRLLRTNVLSRLKRRGVEIHARSIFLQGLLLMDPAELPANLAAAREPLARLREWCREAGTTPLAAALAFVLARPEIDVALCGVNTVSQLEEILRAARNPMETDWRRFGVDDEMVLDPPSWNVKRSA